MALRSGKGRSRKIQSIGGEGGNDEWCMHVSGLLC